MTITATAPARDNLPTAFMWRGITMKRVPRVLDASPIFHGFVGLWLYSLEQQADGSWLGQISMRNVGNACTQTHADPMAAMDAAAAWWRETVNLLPAPVLS